MATSTKEKPVRLKHIKLLLRSENLESGQSYQTGLHFSFACVCINQPHE